MKLKLYLLCLLLAGFAFQSCHDDDDDSLTDVPAAVKEAFNQRYPDVSVKEWEMELGLVKAEFRNGTQEAEAWFKPDGTWVRTETDMPVDALPKAVQDYVAANHPGYRIDDADYLESPEGNFYELELEKAGSPDVYLQIRADGSLRAPGLQPAAAGLPA